MREECFTIGLYTGSGQYASLYRNEFDIQFHHKHHLEKVCNEISAKTVFLPFIETDFSAKKWVILSKMSIFTTEKCILLQYYMC